MNEDEARSKKPVEISYRTNGVPARVTIVGPSSPLRTNGFAIGHHTNAVSTILLAIHVPDILSR